MKFQAIFDNCGTMQMTAVRGVFHLVLLWTTFLTAASGSTVFIGLTGLIMGRKSKWIRPRPVLCALKWAPFCRESSLDHELPHKSCKSREVTWHRALRIAAAHISTSLDSWGFLSAQEILISQLLMTSDDWQSTWEGFLMDFSCCWPENCYHLFKKNSFRCCSLRSVLDKLKWL